MYYHDTRLQYPVRANTPDPLFARQPQQAIGGLEGEIRVCLQYFFQAWGAHADRATSIATCSCILLHTATEEIGHIEMLATAVALNLDTAPATLQESAVQSGSLVSAVMGGGERPRHMVEGMLQKHLLSTGMATFPGNSDGLPFDCSHVYASGNLAADMFANVTAESTGRLLAVRLFNAAHDEGMRDMLSFLIARDTMHQQQWLAVIEELGGTAALPIPNSFDQQEFSYVFLATNRDAIPPAVGPWSEGPSLDRKGTFSVRQNKPLGEEPVLGPARPDSGAQREQMGPV